MTPKQTESIETLDRELRNELTCNCATIEIARDDVRNVLAAVDELKSELEQERVQHAGCLTAAEGWIQEPAAQGDYGWSVAYQKTLELRRKFNAIQQAVTQFKTELATLPESAAFSGDAKTLLGAITDRANQLFP